MASVTATSVLCRAPVAGKRAARAAPAAARVAAPTRTTSSVSLKGSKGAFEGVAMRAERRGAALRAITDTKETATDVEEEKPEPALESDVRPPLALSNASSRPPVSSHHRPSFAKSAYRRYDARSWCPPPRVMDDVRDRALHAEP